MPNTTIHYKEHLINDYNRETDPSSKPLRRQHKSYEHPFPAKPIGYCSAILQGLAQRVNKFFELIGCAFVLVGATLYTAYHLSVGCLKLAIKTISLTFQDVNLKASLQAMKVGIEGFVGCVGGIIGNGIGLISISVGDIVRNPSMSLLKKSVDSGKKI